MESELFLRNVCPWGLPRLSTPMQSIYPLHRSLLGTILSSSVLCMDTYHCQNNVMVSYFLWSYNNYAIFHSQLISALLFALSNCVLV